MVIAVVIMVDRLGFHVRLKTQDGSRGARIAFLREVNGPAEARKVLVEMVGVTNSNIHHTNTVPKGKRFGTRVTSLPALT